VTRHLAGRVVRGLLIVLGVTTMVFFASRLTGDPATLTLGASVSDQQIDHYRKIMGWDRPLGWQYVRYVESAFHGDFGASFYYEQDALRLVLERLPATVELTVAALFFAVAVGVVTGVAAAVRRDTPLDAVIMSIAVAGRAVPVFWLALLLIYVFAVRLHALPVAGRDAGILSLVLPALSLGAVQAAEIARLTRSSMVDIMTQDYIRTARSKGLPPRIFLTRHALRNALVPVVTIVGLQLGNLLGGAVVTETIFSWPGVGQLAVASILRRDFPVVQVSVLFLAVGFVTISVLLDAVYPLLDPRIIWAPSAAS
jgi:peptide/nickel transport system permease protein